MTLSEVAPIAFAQQSDMPKQPSDKARSRRGQEEEQEGDHCTVYITQVQNADCMNSSKTLEEKAMHVIQHTLSMDWAVGSMGERGQSPC